MNNVFDSDSQGLFRDDRPAEGERSDILTVFLSRPPDRIGDLGFRVSWNGRSRLDCGAEPTSGCRAGIDCLVALRVTGNGGKQLESKPKEPANDPPPGVTVVKANAPQTPAATPKNRIISALAAVGVLAGLYGLLWWSGALAVVTDGPSLRAWIEGLGGLGPLTIIALLATAIVLNPIPSAPIALAAGAAYGHVWGTVYVVIGAEAGALIAFMISRMVGQDAVARWLGRRPSLGALRSQNALMAIVFISRLMPFFSFDLVSYAAGFTPLTAWRFAAATLAGIIPANFLLAHFGGEMAAQNAGRAMVAVLVVGALTLVPILVKLMIDRRRALRQASDKET